MTIDLKDEPEMSGDPDAILRRDEATELRAKEIGS